MKTYTTKDIDKELAGAIKWGEGEVEITFVSDYIGGQPSARDDVKNFCKHHLGLTTEAEVDEATARILGEEVRIDQPDDELEEKQSYGLNVIRRDSQGRAYVGTWQIRAMLKQAASRLGIFVKKKGSKGDMAEMLMLSPLGFDDLDNPQTVILQNPDGTAYTDRKYRKFMGSVTTPQGRKSIVHDSEYAPAGCKLRFGVRWPIGKVKVRDMLKILGAGQNIALGSVRSMECGRFTVDTFKDLTVGHVDEDE